MAEEATWGVGIIVRWILIIVIILLTIWAVYNFILKPITSTFNETIIPLIFLLASKSFKSVFA